MLIPSLLPVILFVIKTYIISNKLIYKTLLFVVSYAVAMLMTNLAYHVRNAYGNFPEPDVFLFIGLIWSFIVSSPNIVAINLKTNIFYDAFVTSIVLAALTLFVITPVNFVLILLFSLE